VRFSPQAASARRHGVPPGTVAGDPDRPLVAVGGGLNRDLEAVLGEPFGQPPAPLHDGDRATHVSVEIQVVHFGDGMQAVRVRVHQRRAGAGRGRVDPGDDEGRGGDRAAHPESLADALHQRGLARSERAGQDHQVAGAQESGELAAEVPHRGVGGDAQVRGVIPPLVRDNHG
jgi:hypothetical protein